MRRHLLRALGAVLGVGLLLGIAGCGLSLQQVPTPGGLRADTYSVTATFTDVLNLPATAEVREGARVVGEVGTMELDGYDARIELRILADVEYPRGTTAEVRFDNPLGDQYVELHRPAQAKGAVWRDGDVLPRTDTMAAPTVEDTLGAFATVLTGGGIGDLQSITHELNQALDGNQADVRQFLTRLNKAADQLAGGLGPIDKALTEVARLSSRLHDGQDTLTKGLDTIAPALVILADENEEFRALLSGLDAFGKAGNRVVTQSGRQTLRALKALVPVVNQVVESRDRLPAVLRNLRTFAAQLPGVTQYGYARTSLSARVAFDSSPSVATGSPAARSGGDSLMTRLGPLEAAPRGPR